ncbi:MAG: arginine--tRNA ligase, partial [Clostridia bacterium]|nr:arginine--tRNA ligase [Clostridia bacterium]
CVEKAYSIINEKNPNLEDKESVAEAVGTGAVIFGALINSRIKDIVFSYDKVLNFEGETAPYVQYTYARCVSLLQKAGNNVGEYKVENLLKQEYDLISMLAKFEDVVLSSAEKNEPSLVTRYAVDVASLFNKFYFDCKILGEEENVKNFRLAITSATKTVIKNALSLLGIKTPQKM